MKRVIVYGTLLFVLINCSGLVMEEKIIDNYYLVATDVEDACNLSYKETEGENYGTVVDATVFGVGYNDKYLIIKQHPRVIPQSPDRKKTNYYILPIKEGMDWKSKNGLLGPLNKVQFEEKKKELNIEPITFTKVIKDLE